MRKFVAAIATFIVLAAAVAIAPVNHPVYAQANAGAQSIYFQQARSGDSNFSETGFSSAGVVKCPDGRHLGNIIFGLSAFKSPRDGRVHGNWSAEYFAVFRADSGALADLSVKDNRFEAKGDFKGGFIAGTQTNKTALMCDGTPIGNNASVSLSGQCGQNTAVDFAATSGITGTFYGNVTCTAGETKPVKLTVTSEESGSNAPSPLAGMWATVRTEDGRLVGSGFTPVTFAVNSSTIYKVSLADYAGIKLELWDGPPFWDSDPHKNTRTVILSSDTTVGALYVPEIHLVKGFTELTNPADALPPALKVRATSLDGNQTLGMWTIIRQPPDVLAESNHKSYIVYVHDYKDYVFDHWNDGSKDRVRTLTIAETTTITAFYRKG